MDKIIYYMDNTWKRYQNGEYELLIKAKNQIVFYECCLVERGCYYIKEEEKNTKKKLLYDDQGVGKQPKLKNKRENR